MARSLSIWNYNSWRCSKLFLYYVSPFWNLVPLQQITLIKKHKGNLPLLLVCTWRQRLSLLWLFSCKFFEKKFYSIDPPKWPPCHALQTKNYSSQLIDCYWMLSIMALGHFWAILKNCSCVSGICIFGLRLLRS